METKTDYCKAIADFAQKITNEDYLRHIYLFTKATYEREKKGGVAE